MKLFKHIKTVLIHKYYVCKFCFRFKLYKQGILHDLSKFSPSEFFLSVKYYQGYRSPIDYQRSIDGYSSIWLHHKGHNKHHIDYWNDNGYYVKIPQNILLETLCDKLSASITYKKKDFTQSYPLEFFLNGNEKNRMHPDSKKELEYYLTLISEYGIDLGINKIKEHLLDNTYI